MIDIERLKGELDCVGIESGLWPDQALKQTAVILQVFGRWGFVRNVANEVSDAVVIVSRSAYSSVGLPPVLDVCCGTKGMWFDKQDERALFLDRRRETHVDTYPCGTKTNIIDPDVIGDFTDIRQPDNSFYLVVFDPPHIEQGNESQITKKYGALNGDWRTMLKRGFAECFRVLKPNGVLIFKWNDCRFPVKKILSLIDEKPLFGHKSGKKMQTHWIAFIKAASQPL